MAVCSFSALLPQIASGSFSNLPITGLNKSSVIITNRTCAIHCALAVGLRPLHGLIEMSFVETSSLIVTVVYAMFALFSNACLYCNLAIDFPPSFLSFNGTCWVQICGFCISICPLHWRCPFGGRNMKTDYWPHMVDAHANESLRRYDLIVLTEYIHLLATKAI